MRFSIEKCLLEAIKNVSHDPKQKVLLFDGHKKQKRWKIKLFPELCNGGKVLCSHESCNIVWQSILWLTSYKVECKFAIRKAVETSRRKQHDWEIPCQWTVELRVESLLKLCTGSSAAAVKLSDRLFKLFHVQWFHSMKQAYKNSSIIICEWLDLWPLIKLLGREK